MSDEKDSKVEEVDANTGEIVEGNLPVVRQQMAIVSPDESLKLALVAKQLFASGLYPHLGNHAGVFAVVEYGRELGVGAMVALQNISIIKGRPACNGQLLLALAAKVGVKWDVVEEGAERCSIHFKREGQEYLSTFSMEDAKRAGLAGGVNYTKYPSDMLYWRAVAKGTRRICPDATMGLYTVDEMTDGRDREVAEVSVEQIEKQLDTPESDQAQGGVSHDEREAGILASMKSSRDDGFCWACKKRHTKKGDPIVKFNLPDKEGVWGHQACYLKHIAQTTQSSENAADGQGNDSRGHKADGVKAKANKPPKSNGKAPGALQKEAEILEADICEGWPEDDVVKLRLGQAGGADLLTASNVGLQNYIEHLQKLKENQ